MVAPGWRRDGREGCVGCMWCVVGGLLKGGVGGGAAEMGRHD